jgi:hypothetical protein
MTASEDIGRFVALLETHGAERSRWPAEEVKAAEALLARSDDARRELDRARALEALLDGALRTRPIDAAASRARVLEAIARRDRLGQWLAWLGRGPWLLRPIAMALVPLTLGLAIGIAAPPTDSDEEEMLAELHVLAFDAEEAYRDGQ